MTIEIASIPTKEYKEIIEVRVPVRFYWNPDDTFDGIEFGEFQTNLQDGYCRIARNNIPQLLAGYISNKGWLGNVVKGSIEVRTR